MAILSLLILKKGYGSVTISYPTGSLVITEGQLPYDAINAGVVIEDYVYIASTREFTSAEGAAYSLIVNDAVVVDGLQLRTVQPKFGWKEFSIGAGLGLILK